MTSSSSQEGEPLDLRLAPSALACWTVVAVGLGWPPGRSMAGAVVLAGAGAVLLRGGPVGSPRTRSAAVATLVVASVALALAGLRVATVQAGPLSALASEGSSVRLSGSVTSDPVRKDGRFAPYVLVSLSVNRVVAHGQSTRVRSPVLVIGSLDWLGVRYGEEIEAFGRLQTPEGPDLAAVLVTDGAPLVVARAGWVQQRIATVRAGLQTAARPLAPSERALLPALVDGDVTGMPEQTTADFKTTGLTHLLAVSGSNLTLVLSFVLLVTRRLGVRGYGSGVVGVVAVGFFVLLARPQPSVLRAAAMGLVAIAGLSSGSRTRGVRVLCVAVVGLLLLDPWLARSVGFVLSTLATAGIILLGPPWRDLLTRWLPRPLAEAVAVPLAAQLVCTPVIAAISGQVSLVAVLANMAVAPVVGPATVAGLLAGLLALVSGSAGQLAGRLAGVPLWWIVQVATHGARLSGASLGWSADPLALLMLALGCLAVIGLLPLLLPRRLPCLAAVGVLVVALLHPVSRPGWPPAGWVMVMCDVGQGDGLVLNAGAGAAVVVDTGPDPVLMRRCLAALGIRQIPLVVLTHFHADHVDGLSAVLGGWPVGEIETSPYDEPADRYATVTALAEEHGVRESVAVVGERRRLGALSWQVLGPPMATASGVGDSGSGPNNASVIMLVRVAGLRILLAGDAEPAEEDAMLAGHPDLRVDVLKEPHHGSAAQDPTFLAATRAAVSLISVGADNPYGHPAPQTLTWLHDLGMLVYRTDQHGDVAVVPQGDSVVIATSH